MSPRPEALKTFKSPECARGKNEKIRKLKDPESSEPLEPLLLEAKQMRKA